MSDKMAFSHKEEVIEKEHAADLDRTRTVDIENYHGLTAKTVLVYLSICLIGWAQLQNIVGAGAFGNDIAQSVGGSSEKVWLSQAIVIVTVILGPIVSQAADYWGRKWFLVICTFCGCIGSIVVSRATSMHMAIAGQVICGLTYGAQPLLYAVASEVLPRRWRPAAQGGINAALACGGITALLGGSAFVKEYNEGWRMFWYLTAALLFVAAVINIILYNPPARPLQKSLTTKEKLARLDWVAYALLAIGIVLFSIALSWAKNPYPWTSVQVLVPFFLGIAFLIALVVHQTFFKKDGLFHHQLFSNDRNFALSLFIIFVDGMVFFAANTYFAFEVSVLYETDPIRIGLRFCMVFFSSVVSSFIIAWYSSVRRTVRGPIVVSFVLFMIFFICMATANLSTSAAVWFYPNILGFGVGFSLTCLVTAAQMSAPPALIAISSGLVIAMRSFGASISLAIYQAEFSSAISSHLGADIAAAVLPLGLNPRYLPDFITDLANENDKALAMIPGVTPQIIGAGVHGLQEAYLSTFRLIWITAAALSAVAAIAACFLVNPKRDFNMHVDAPLEED